MREPGLKDSLVLEKTQNTIHMVFAVSVIGIRIKMRRSTDKIFESRITTGE